MRKGIVSFIAIFIALVLCNNQAFFVNDEDFSPIPNFTNGNSNNSWLVSAGGYSSLETISHMDIDSNGNVFVVGKIWNNEDSIQEVYFGENIIQTSSLYLTVIAKLNSHGVWQWSKVIHEYYDGGNDFTITSLKSGTLGQIFFAGSYDGYNITIAGHEISKNEDSEDGYVGKLNPDGSLDWIKTISSNLDDSQLQGSYECGDLWDLCGDTVTDISVNQNDEIFVTGDFCGDSRESYQCHLTLDQRTVSTIDDSDIFVAQLSNNGQWGWLKKAGSPGEDEGGTIHISNLGEIIISGLIDEDESYAIFGGLNLTLSNNDEDDMSIISKISSSGQWGWAKSLSYHRYDVPKVMFNSNNEIIVIADLEYPTTFSSYALNAGDFIAKFSNQGNVIWAKEIPNVERDESSLAIDDSNNIFLSGGVYNYPSTYFDDIEITPTGTIDAFVGQLSTDGYWQWVIQFNGPSSQSNSVAVDDSGSIFSSGSFGTSMTFGETELTSIGGGDMYVAKLDISDPDGDGILSVYDNCQSISNPNQIDSDQDGEGDDCDLDDDNDFVNDEFDLCQNSIEDFTSNSQSDYDGDGCEDGQEDNDDDNDGVVDFEDLCPKGQLSGLDYDNDGCKDTEDNDDDGDGVLDEQDECQAGQMTWISSSENDWDGDGCRDVDEDNDDDNDGLLDTLEVSQFGTNPKNPDTDGDGLNDSWEIMNGLDPLKSESSEITSDRDGDGVSDENDKFPDNPSEWEDSDNDGIGDNSDAFPQDSSRTEIETNSSTTDENINQTITANNTSNIDTSLEEKENSNSDVTSSSKQSNDNQITEIVLIVIAFCSVAILLVLIIRRKRINSKPRLPTIPIPIPNQSIIQSPSLSISKPIPPLPNLPLPNLPLPNLPLPQPVPLPGRPAITNQWTDERGYYWRKMSDGELQWWDGTKWITYSSHGSN